jgi:hypothetical protein
MGTLDRVKRLECLVSRRARELASRTARPLRCSTNTLLPSIPTPAQPPCCFLRGEADPGWIPQAILRWMPHPSCFGRTSRKGVFRGRTTFTAEGAARPVYRPVADLGLPNMASLLRTLPPDTSWRALRDMIWLQCTISPRPFPSDLGSLPGKGIRFGHPRARAKGAASFD